MLSSLRLLRIRSRGSRFLLSMTSSSSLQSVGPKQKFQFYRRPLPQSCIDFASEEGRTIFKEALHTGHMTCFFKLSAQFRTQDEPSYCGLTSLVMALNVLEIDPGRVWKGAWRWYHEEMLDCCVSLDIVKEKGINIEQFVCIARCNNLSVEHLCGTHFESVDQLRAFVKEKTQVDNQVVIVSYSRKTLGQTGSGHFSPIAGYHEDKDLVLILDTARFKYPPHWIPVTVLMEAMRVQDDETGLPRGVVVLSRSDEYVGTLLYRPSCSLLISNPKGTIVPQVWHFSDAWNLWLDERQDPDSAETQRIEYIQYFVKTVLERLQDTALFCLVMQSKVQRKCDSLCCHLKCSNVSSDEEEEIRSMYISLITQLESMKTYEIMKEVLSTLHKEDRVKLMKLVACSEFFYSENTVSADSDYNYQACTKHNSPVTANPKDAGKKWSVSIRISPENILTILFLMWPVNQRVGGDVCEDKGSRREWMNTWFKEDLKGNLKLTIRQEVLSLHVKVVEVLNYHLNDASKAFVPIRAF